MLNSKFLKTFSLKKPIKLKEYEKVLKNYDIGIIPYLSKSLNYDYCSPNKFGDYVSNGLIVCSSGTSELKEIIKKIQLDSVIIKIQYTILHQLFINM